MKAKEAGGKIIQALTKGRRLSESIINYVEREHRVEDWAKKNISAILECRKMNNVGKFHAAS